jgi:transcriptional regulator with XRE-family HTH domain
MGGRGGVCDQEREYNAEISSRIERLRKEGLVQRSDLARAAGLRVSMLYNYEVGLARWSAFRLALIAEYLRVPINQIMPRKTLNVESPHIDGELS